MRTALRFQDWVRVGKTLLAQFAWQNNAFFSAQSYKSFRQWPGVRLFRKI